MISEEFEKWWALNLSAEPDEKWFNSVLAFNRKINVEQRDELRRRLGWAKEFCSPLSDAEIFGATWSQRVREHFTDEAHLLVHLSALAKLGWLEDYRDQLIALSGLYHAMILAGFDPHEILTAVALSAPAQSADVIHGFLSRKDKDLTKFGYIAERNNSGHVQICRA